MIEIRVACSDDLPHLAAFMPAEDVSEIASTGRTPLQALGHALEDASEAWTWFYGGEPAALFGVGHSGAVAAPEAYLWLYPTSIAVRHPQTFCRIARRYVRRTLRAYGRLITMVDAENPRRLAWMQFLGFRALAIPVIQVGDHRWSKFEMVPWAA